ncbi:MAG: AbrB/MazE/SpoVT family DNA-binding domain-containing protein [Nocardioidaceae bacterium]
MSGTYTVSMGDRGRLVVPAELRDRLRLSSGTPLVLVETPHGVVMTTREQLHDLVRENLAGRDLVQDLLDERRAAAERDDAA